uniref:Multiple epidermal growth factor-like domains protein 10 n=1 Tax=Crassostrea virginica TaxID=6565 RepID=A0A8B8BNH4_CRAVI|nr:multiple epidermal growth factor-like domains protein 10 [Crassostrea virginica]
MFALCIVFGFFVASFAYENIALHKPAQEAFPYIHGNVSPGNAVDRRKTDLRGLGGQCSLSDKNKTNATWWVNLTSILSIHHITIYYRTDNAPWGPSNGYTHRFLGFSVYVSNTTNRLDWDLCFKDSSFTISNIPKVFTTNCIKHGLYVIYHNERLANKTYPADYSLYAYNDLCEVEVYGCPTPGFYGASCSIPCPDPNCRYCHIETGTCQGCKPGYQSHQCESACAKGFYGQDCQLTCNDKCDGCNNVNGYCDRGCKPGWTGDNCQQRNRVPMDSTV